jgi:hypothetical protein
MRTLIVALMALLLAACSAPEGEYLIPAQKWEDVVIKVESQPAPVVAGMNEFLVLATLERGRPVHDLIVSLRSTDAQSWQQAIQDGHSGVYRKAINVPAGVTELQVQLRRKRSESEVVLRFPLFPEQVGAAPSPR